MLKHPLVRSEPRQLLVMMKMAEVVKGGKERRAKRERKGRKAKRRRSRL